MSFYPTIAAYRVSEQQMKSCSTDGRVVQPHQRLYGGQRLLETPTLVRCPAVVGFSTMLPDLKLGILQECLQDCLQHCLYACQQNCL